MTVKDCLEMMDIWEGEDRRKIVPLIYVLTPISKDILLEIGFTSTVQQNDLIRACVNAEINDPGLRSFYGLVPLTMETEL